MAETVETRYFRYVTDTHTINGLTLPKLLTSTSGTLGSTLVSGWFVPPYTDLARANCDVIIRHADNSETTLGSAVAETTHNNATPTLVSNTWSCPATSLQTDDAVKIVLRAKSNGGTDSTQSFITEQVTNWAGSDKGSLLASTWTFRYRLIRGDDGEDGVKTNIRYGYSAGEYDTRIEGFTYGTASINLAADATCVATATADLVVQTYISAAAAAVCSASANLTTAIHLSASAVAECSVTANLLVSGWSASATVQCTATAALDTGITMAANAACVATAHGNLQVGGLTEDIDWLLQDSNGLITGAAGLTSLKIGKRSTGGLLDWNDLTFKTSGWGTLATSFQEVDSTNQRGLYRKTIELDLWADGKYYALLDYAGSPEKHYGIEFTVEGGKMAGDYVISKLDINVASRLAAADYTAPDNEGIASILEIVTLLKKYARNKRTIWKDPATGIKYLIIYDDNGTTELVRKSLKDPTAANIADLAVGSMALEEASSV